MQVGALLSSRRCRLAWQTGVGVVHANGGAAERKPCMLGWSTWLELGRPTVGLDWARFHGLPLGVLLGYCYGPKATKMDLNWVPTSGLYSGPIKNKQSKNNKVK